MPPNTQQEQAKDAANVQEGQGISADAPVSGDDAAAVINDSAVSTSSAEQAALLGAAGHDPSDTFTHGAPGANVSRAIPEGATFVGTYEDALEAGYFGYAAGAEATEQYTVPAKVAQLGATVNAAADSPKESKSKQS